MSILIDAFDFRSIRELRAYRYPYGGYEFVELKGAPAGPAIIRPVEMDLSSFDAFSIELCRGHKQPGALPSPEHVLDFAVDRVTVLRRDEWLAGPISGESTVGSSPKLIETGPAGSAPKDATAVTVVAGVGLSTASSDVIELLIYLSDTPGSLEISDDAVAIAEFASRLTAKAL